MWANKKYDWGMVMRYYPSGTISRNAYPTKRVRKCL
jgi:hypothetical protein